MKKKLVIFDLDGTLVNTIADLAASTNHALRQLGFPTHPTERYKMMVGNGINQLFRRALPESAQTDANVLRMRQEFLPYYHEHIADFSRPYPGIPELLSTCQQEGILLAVASNKYQEGATKLIATAVPSVSFSIVLGQREGVAIKPDPQIVYDILAATGVSKEDTLYVGDSGVDMQTGANAAVDTCGVTWGFRSREELEAFHPQHIIDDPEELKTIICMH